MSNPADWLVGAAKRHPEGLLVIAAGCALLMRGGGSSAPATPPMPVGSAAPALPSTKNAWNISRVADKAGEMASDLGGRVADTASSVTSYAAEMGSSISRQTSDIAAQTQTTVQGWLSWLVQEEPLAIAALGLVAGAATAALLPATEIEERTLSGAREAIADAAHRLEDSVIGAASEAGEQLRQGLTERAPQVLKEVVNEAADTFTERLRGETDQGSSGANGRPTPPNRAS